MGIWPEPDLQASAGNLAWLSLGKGEPDAEEGGVETEASKETRHGPEAYLIISILGQEAQYITDI